MKIVISLLYCLKYPMVISDIGESLVRVFFALPRIFIAAAACKSADQAKRKDPAPAAVLPSIYSETISAIRRCPFAFG